jgi:hypothetical protein
MGNILRRLFGGTVAQPGGQIHDPASPEYVPTPKAKVPGAQHPLVKSQGKARGVGIVYGADGRPKITRDWLDNLSPEQRAAVDKDLLANGWRVNENYSIDKVPPVGTPIARIPARS